MGIISRSNQKIKQAQKEKINAFMKEITEVNKKYNLQLVPFIDKYGANFEIQEIPKPSVEIPKIEENKLST